MDTSSSHSPKLSPRNASPRSVTPDRNGNGHQSSDSLDSMDGGAAGPSEVAAAAATPTSHRLNAASHVSDIQSMARMQEESESNIILPLVSRLVPLSRTLCYKSTIESCNTDIDNYVLYNCMMHQHLSSKL